MVIIDVTELRNNILKDIKEKISNERFKTIPKPHLVIVQIGDDLDSAIAYEKETCESVGIIVSVYKYEQITIDKLKEIVQKLSLTSSVTGIVLHAVNIDVMDITNEINPDKDVTCRSTQQVGKFFTVDDHSLYPILLNSIKNILENETELKDKTIMVIGSTTIGVELSMILYNNVVINAPINNTDDSNFDCYCRMSDIIVLADYIKLSSNNIKNKIIIDLYTPKYDFINNEVCSNLKENRNIDVRYISPSDVGHICSAMLAYNVYLAYENQFDYIWNHCQNLQISEADINDIN